MRTILHRLRVVVAIAVMAGSLGGCGTINGWLAAGFEDFIPAWAGGLPADAVLTASAHHGVEGLQRLCVHLGHRRRAEQRTDSVSILLR